MMKHNLRLAAYAGICLACLGVMLVVPGVWAAPSSRHQASTVPTRGPTPTLNALPTPTEAPTTQPPSTELPPGQPPATPIADATATLAPSSTATTLPALLLLTKEADRFVVWPGLEVTFTLALTNRGSASVRDVFVEDALPAELMPGAVQGSGAAWEGRTLRARTPVLAPGGRYVIVFTARVREDLTAGGIIVNQAAATVTGGQRATAGIMLALPPAELPPTGAGMLHTAH